MNDRGQTTLELVLLSSAIILLVAVGTRLVRNMFYPMIHEVQNVVQDSAKCGEPKCTPNGIAIVREN